MDTYEDSMRSIRRDRKIIKGMLFITVQLCIATFILVLFLSLTIKV